MGLFDFLGNVFGSPVRRKEGAAPPPPPPPAPPSSLAGVLESTPDELRWLADPWRMASSHSPHYVTFRIPKRRGGLRVILAPKRRLKAVQRRILEKILYRRAASASAHGFVKGRSIVTNARPHVGARVLVKADLVDFFHTIGFPRVRGVFEHTPGIGPDDAELLAHLCTAPVMPLARGRDAAEFFGKTPGRRRVAVQGAPTSPAISNLVCRGLDARLAGLAVKFKANYTRYADDLSFSGGAEFEADLKSFLPLLREIIEDEGFTLSERKFIVAHSGSRQRVAGLVVNRKLSVGRRNYRRLKAILHNCRAKGPASQAHGVPIDRFRAHLEGRIAYVRSIEPEKAAKLAAAFARIAWPA